MDKITFSLLKLYNDRNGLTLIQLGAIFNTRPLDLANPVVGLKKRGFLEHDPRYVPNLQEDDYVSLDTPLCISYPGKCAYLEASEAKREQRWHQIHLWITTCIAVAGLLVALLKP